MWHHVARQCGYLSSIVIFMGPYCACHPLLSETLLYCRLLYFFRVFWRLRHYYFSLMCEHVCVGHTYICAHNIETTGLPWILFLNIVFPLKFFFKMGPSTGLDLMILLGLLAGKPQGASDLCLFSAEISSTCWYPRLFHLGCRDWTHGLMSARWALSQLSCYLSLDYTVLFTTIKPEPGTIAVARSITK